MICNSPVESGRRRPPVPCARGLDLRPRGHEVVLDHLGVVVVEVGLREADRGLVGHEDLDRPGILGSATLFVMFYVL